MSGSEAISPTAHYTGYVWARNGLSHRALETVEGRVLFETLRPVMTANALLGRGTLESYLLARHRAIDAVLERAIAQGVTQVIEVAAGLSPRGWRFVQRHPELVYIDADLPGMTARKRGAIEQMDTGPGRHVVRELDVLREDGPESLAAVSDELDQHQGLAIITEGLLPYLPTDEVKSIWHRFAATLNRFGKGGAYISDVHVGTAEGAPEQAFRMLLSLFVRGRVHLHFESTDAVAAALRAAGFATAEVHPATELVAETRRDRTSRIAHILEASTITTERAGGESGG